MSTPSQVEEIFLAAIEKKTAAERASYLEHACRHDPALRLRVERLLAAHSQAADFLVRPAVERHGLELLDTAEATGEFAPPQSSQDLGETATGRLETLERLAAERGAHAAGDLTFLAPSAKPGSLGRLAHYEVLEVLGRGGFGTVVKAFDEKLHRLVAIKILSPLLAATSPPRKRFLREARSAAAVRHENVVAIHAVEDQPIPYLVMEYVAGQTLQERLDGTGPLCLREVLAIGRQIAGGLAAAHAMGLTHRDIKPSNILLEDGIDQVKITDFGLARAADDASITQSGVIAGTPMYMAPEQASADPIDHRADLFSLGSVLYVMCTGRPPFRAPSTLAVLKRVTEDTPRPIQEIIPEIPAWLCDLITQLHAKKPADRTTGAQEVADLLARQLFALQQPSHHQDFAPAPPSAMQEPALFEEFAEKAPASQFPHNRRRQWVAAAALIILLIGGLGLCELAGVTDFRGTVVRLFSRRGTLVVEIEDPGISVRIDGSIAVITGPGVKEFRLKPGSYTLRASKDGKLVREELVTITSKGRQVVRISQEAGASEWERSVAALPAEVQVQAVAARLQELNPGFDGHLDPGIDQGVVISLSFHPDHGGDISPVRALPGLTAFFCTGGPLVDLAPLKSMKLSLLDIRLTSVADLTPLTGMPLKTLICDATKVADLAPLAGMKLDTLACGGTVVSDLSPLAGMPMTRLTCQKTSVADLAPLKGMKLVQLHCDGTGVPDLTPLKGMPLATLDCSYTAVTSLAPLQGAPLTRLLCSYTPVADLRPLEKMPLTSLEISGTKASDLSPLSGIPLEHLACDHTQVTDFSPLREMPLKELSCDFVPERDTAILRSIKTLQTINGKPAAQFWAEIDGQTKGP